MAVFCRRVEGLLGKDSTLRFRMLSPFPVAGWKRGEGETESDESGLSVPPPRVSTSSMVDCPARFIRQIGRGRGQEIANSCRIIAELFYRGREEEEQQEDPLRASTAAPPPLSPPHVSRVYAAATVHTPTGHTRVNLRPYGASGVRSTRCLRRRRQRP